MRKILPMFLIGALAAIALTGCGNKKNEGPVEVGLTALSLNDLQAGQFYVKSGDAYYHLPIEDCNFELTAEVKSTDNKDTGMIAGGIGTSRIVDFIYADNAIPTLYKNDTLVYVAESEISSFTWERYLDCGYSIGLSGLQLDGSGKAVTGENLGVAANSSIISGLSSDAVTTLTGIIFDKINGTPITAEYLDSDTGIIKGMSKDATAQIDAFIGTTHIPMTASADTRFFRSFELFKSEQYSLSTDGYAIVEVPSYFKSGYYLLNNTGFVKFLNIDRGNDESGVDLTVPYYYEGEDGVMTYYEWREVNGYTDEVKQTKTDEDFLDVSEYPERMKIVTDSTAVGLNVSVNYSYRNESAEKTASQNGTFPRAVLMDPYGTLTPLESSDKVNEDGSYTLSLALDSAPCGDWYILFRNFENADKSVSAEIVSGNATTYIHSGSSGNITIYYEASATPKVVHATWEQQDRIATGITVQAPDGTRYDPDNNPEMFSMSAGGSDITFPSMVEGNYRFDIKGDALGRVWFSISDGETAAATAPAEGETAAAESETATSEAESESAAG